MRAYCRLFAACALLALTACSQTPPPVTSVQQPRAVPPKQAFHRIPVPTLKPQPSLDQADILARLMPSLQTALEGEMLQGMETEQRARELSRYHELAAPVPYNMKLLVVYTAAEGGAPRQLLPVTADPAQALPYTTDELLQRQSLWHYPERLRLMHWKPVVGSDRWQQLVEAVLTTTDSPNPDKLRRLIAPDLHPLEMPVAEQARLQLSLAEWLIARRQELAALHFLQQAEESTYRIATLDNQDEEPVKSLTNDILRLQVILHKRIPGPFEKVKRAFRKWL